LNKVKISFLTLLAAAAAIVAAKSIFFDKTTLNTVAQQQSICKTAREGDLLLRLGQGLWSELFRKKSPEVQEFSHAGIIKWEGGKVFVIHAEANSLTGHGFVRKDSLESYLNEAVSWAVYRLKGSAQENEALAKNAESLLGTPFNWRFDMADTTTLYCTQLVYVADLISGRKLPFRKHNNILPIDSFQSPAVADLVVRSSQPKLKP